MKKELKTVKLSEIMPYENNPRHNDQAVDAVKESIRQCGYVAPIIVDEDMVILAGHTRYKALKSLGRKQAEVMIVGGVSDEQKRKYRLLDNKTGELAMWDTDLLEIELSDIDFEGYDFDFNIEEIEIDETDLDADETKDNVIVTINCGDQWNYEQIKERLQNLVDEIDGNLSIKMA